MIKTVSLTLLLFTIALLYPFTSYCTQIAIKGVAVSVQTGMPLDSVRVASLFSGNVTYTKSDGVFLIKIADTFAYKPETTVTESCSYSFNLYSSDNKKSVITDDIFQNKYQLVTLSGQVIKNTPLQNNRNQFLPGILSPGIYFFYSGDMHGKPVLNTWHSAQSYTYKNIRKVMKISKPVNPLEDTIYFWKRGYRIDAVAVSGFTGYLTVQLNQKRMVSSDLHNHTVMTDGSFILDSLVKHAFVYDGLDVYVNSEHGGFYSSDTSGSSIKNEQGNNVSLPRWNSLKHYSWPKLVGQRSNFPGKILLQGFEWNCPGHEHASVGFVNDTEQPQAVADFEYQFDFNDDDNSRPGILKKNSYNHANAISALCWLKDKYPNSSYMFINHPSREAIGPYTVSDFRDFHNAAPQVFLGFEGMPGHQKNSTRGNYGYGPTERNRTWGGADYVLAKVGGLWDALLGEGRHLWTIVNCDFHTTSTDNWPGEYEKTWTTVTDSGARAWLEGMRSGEMFITHGDLINQLDFSIDDGVICASMGSDLHCQSSDLLVTIRFKSPQKNVHGDHVAVDHVDLISGLITGKIDPSDKSAFNNPNNQSTKVIARFSSSDWKNENGWNVICTKITCNQPAYFRLRGTNLKSGTPAEVSVQGDPLMDQDNQNTEQIAWKDLWFYSNPIFVYPR